MAPITLHSGYLGPKYLDPDYLDDDDDLDDDLDDDDLDDYLGFSCLGSAEHRVAGMSLFQYANLLSPQMFVDEDDERRIFNPRWLRLDPATVENLTTYNAEAGITHTKFFVINEREPRVDKHTLLVRVRGIYKNDDRRTPGSAGEAAIGVYFGPGSPHNFAARVPASRPQTRRFADIYAVRMALLRVRGRWRNDHSISTVHVVTDSKYVVQALSGDIEEWRVNGFQDEQGEKIPNHSEIENLDRLMLELAEDGVEASFWPVGDLENQEADRLARDVLGLPPH